MRLLILLALNACSYSLTANAADSIAPGMSLSAVVKALESHGYGVGSKYQLQMISGDKKSDLEFCRIDDEISLILGFDKRTKQITSMGIHVYPDSPPRPKAERNVFTREVLEIELEPEGVYTLKLKRNAEPKGKVNSD